MISWSAFLQLSIHLHSLCYLHVAIIKKITTVHEVASLNLEEFIKINVCTVFHICPLSFLFSLFTILLSLSISQVGESVYTCKKEERRRKTLAMSLNYKEFMLFIIIMASNCVWNTLHTFGNFHSFTWFFFLGLIWLKLRGRGAGRCHFF